MPKHPVVIGLIGAGYIGNIRAVYALYRHNRGGDCSFILGRDALRSPESSTDVELTISNIEEVLEGFGQPREPDNAPKPMAHFFQLRLIYVHIND